MSKFNLLYLRKLHRKTAPIMVLPLIVTLITGSLFQIASLTGKGSIFLWLLDFHKGKFGAVDLQFIYPFLNAFGLLMLSITGISMWLKTSFKKRER